MIFGRVRQQRNYAAVGTQSLPDLWRRTPGRIVHFGPIQGQLVAGVKPFLCALSCTGTGYLYGSESPR